MKPRDLAELLLLGALWGASFLFMRMGAVEFGPFALVFLRVAGAAALLLPLLALQGHWGALRTHWRPIALIGVINSALPFLCFALAAYVLSAGLMGVFNATAPIWTALIAWAWLGERPAAMRALGLVVGLAGAAGLAWSRAGLKGDAAVVTPLVGAAACIAATVLYGVAANYSRRRLAGVPPMATAAGSQTAAALVLVAPALWAWPAQPVSPAAWGSAVALAVLCTGLAYILYFRLIAHTGATNAMTVTFLIPVFAMAWGWLVLGERPELDMLAGAAAILVGTALTLGLMRRRAAPATAPIKP
ncbi:MAG: DMT family transporter [Rubrivivax sp.]|nr:DMT family transporter [Rubrivivax sp.]